MSSREQVIIATLCYADIFDYPLTGHEVWQRLISSHLFTNLQIKNTLSSSELVQVKDGYYFLKGREQLVKKRKFRAVYSRKKMKKAIYVSHLLSRIPGVLFIGVSGSLAVDNCTKSDDIDLFFITKSNALWLIRFSVRVLLLVSGQGRKFNNRYGKDKICANLFISEKALRTKKNQRNLYVANEIRQVKSVINKNHTYERYLSENSWIKNYLVNVVIPRMPRKPRKRYRRRLGILRSFNSFFYTCQYLYMKKKITNERIGLEFAYFHPKDRAKAVLVSYHQRLKKYDTLIKDACVKSEGLITLNHPFWVHENTPGS